MRVSWWDPQLLTLPDGRELLMLFLPFDSSHWELLGLAPVALVIVLFALAVTAPLCWALTRNVTAPLGALRLATQALSAGQLDARTPARLTRRKDELGLLAQDFDAMAGRLQALVGTREQLLRTIAHELRSPLARLQLAVELARRRTNGWTCSWTASNARANGSTRWWAIRWRWRRWAPCPSRPTCSTWPKSWTPWSRTRALKRATATSASPGNGPPLRIQGDLESLASAIENVLRNALRFAPTGSSIRLRLLAGLRDVQLEIEDRGGRAGAGTGLSVRALLPQRLGRGHGGQRRRPGPEHRAGGGGRPQGPHLGQQCAASGIERAHRAAAGRDLKRPAGETSGPAGGPAPGPARVPIRT